MQNLIGQTVTYSYGKKSITRKILALVRRRGYPIYQLLDPVTHKHHEAYVSIFNKMFKTHRQSIMKKGTKGKAIGSKQLFTA
jgi:hypothetical protein